MSISNILVNNNYKLYSNDIATTKILTQNYIGNFPQQTGTVRVIKDAKNISLTFEGVSFVSTAGTTITTTIEEDYRPSHNCFLPIVADNLGTQVVARATIIQDGTITIFRNIGDNFGTGNINFKTFTLNYTK